MRCMAVTLVMCDAHLQEMFEKAKYPQRVFVGAVQQLLEIEEACWRPGKLYVHLGSSCSM